METKHTPGPWCFHGDYSEIHTAVDEDGGQVIAEMNPDNDFTGEENAANTRLIAAAPELLAALQHVLIASEDGGDFDDVDFDMLRSAIAKATQ
jgi:hypothetical protein